MIVVLFQALLFHGVLLVWGGANARVLKVPEDGFATIQEAVGAAVSGDTVVVAEGTYRGPGNRDIDFKGKAMVLKSEGGPEGTIIDCQGMGRGFNFHSWENKSSVVSGFTVINGWSQYEGGGIYCFGSSPSIVNCTISSCSAGSKGGGVYCGESSSPVFTDCTILNNRSERGGGVYSALSAPSLIRCTISKNEATEAGAGIYGFLSPIVLDHSVVIGNKARDDGGGIYCNASSPVVTASSLTGNRAGVRGGGIYCLFASPVLTNSVIVGNRAVLGAGVYSAALSAPELTNCAFSRNIALDQGGALYCSHSSPVIFNSILWGDRPGEIYLEGAASPRVGYSDIQGGFEGEGNVDADPGFVGRKDLHLQASSPCLDRGTNHAPRLPMTDRAGHNRIINGVADMGPFELTPYTLARGGNRLIRHPDGLSIPVIKGEVKGRLAYGKVKNGTVIFAGWAADSKNGQLVEAVVIFLNGRFFYAGKTEVDRKDVAKYLKNPALIKSGFKFELLSSFPDNTCRPEVRIFAVSKAGLASEFRYPRGYQWSKKKKKRGTKQKAPKNR